jgi:hypothetical protein
MKRNKKLLAVTVAAALTAATAVPALALENEFHGTFTSYYDLSNYSAAGNDGGEQFKADGTPGARNAQGLRNIDPNTGADLGKAKTENYFVQRVRLGYNAKASDQVKLVTKFELDYTFWGNSSYAVGRNSGGALGADSVNIETKNLYLELTYPAINAKIGMQGYNDSFKGILFDADMAGVLLSHDYSNASVAAGFFRFADKGDLNSALGRNSYDMISLDAKYNITKDIKVGGAYYYINDNRSNGSTSVTTPNGGALATGTDSAGNLIYPVGTTFTTTTTNNAANAVKIHNLGLNAEALVGPITLSGFALAQFGDISDSQLGNQSVTHKAHGYALNAGVKVPVAGGTARSELIYVSGGNTHNFYVPGTSNGGTEGGGFYDSEMIMLNRDKNAKTIDTALVYDSNNYNQGLIMGSVGYDYPISDKLSASANAGFAAVASNVTNSGTSDYLGTEVNAESNYKLNANTTVGVRAGYVFLGDYFKGLNADNPYDFKIIANYTF